MFFNRDLSWITFNHRVLQEAKDPEVPLYERLKFLAIFSSNLDEFFRVRYPTVVAFSHLDKKTIKKESLLSKDDVAEKIQSTINDQLNEFGKILLEDIIPGLEAAHVIFYYNKPLLPQHNEEIKEIFLSKVLSFIQPVFLGSTTPKDFLPENNGLYFVVTIKDKMKETISHVMVNIPSEKLQRFFTLTPVDGNKQVVFIDDIIRQNIDLIFPGQTLEGIYSIKFNRDADIILGDDYTGKLLQKMEDQLKKRDVGAASRLLYESGMPGNLQLFLSSIFNVKMSNIFEGSRYHNLSDLMSFPSFDKSLHYKKEVPVIYTPARNLFNRIRQKDILLHLPYHSYTPVLSFFNQAAVDADVKEIYITLYRVAKESHIVNALISAARNGKKVTAFIELKARFDEANNIRWSRIMKQAGVKLIYSKANIKVHSKIALIKKQTEKGKESFAIVATGNFNESTAAFYTDHLLMTADKKVCNELQVLFNFLKKKNPVPDDANIKFNELYVSQFNLVSDFEKLIDEEIKKAKNGLPALIRIKVNNLEESYFINLLYNASKEGVTVNLVVRSICCLVPGITDQSKHITVKRIVDKYLEHSRLFIFGEGDAAVVAMGSSDLMTRNLRRRIEVCLHVKDEDCRQQLIDYFELQWADEDKATVMQSDTQHPPPPHANKASNAQHAIYQYVEKLTC